ncbi:MAG: cell-cell cohesion protein MtsD [Myxococcaceae bacterium]
MTWPIPALAVLALSCTDAFIEPVSTEPTNLDNKLTLRGRVCTSPPDPSGFPVKVVLVVDESGSMCVSDPPGSQEGSGFCEQAAVQAIVPPGVTQPARVRALNKLISQFTAANAAGGNVQIAVVPFETNVKNVWPPTTTGSRFARPDGSLTAYTAALQAQLGKGTDYQGALAYAYTLVAADIAEVSRVNPELLPRTRYVTVFLTDGTPFPRCSANDNLSQYADAQNPDMTWADSSGAGTFCNEIDPTSPDVITGFVKGTDRNQNYQLFSYVDQMMELKDQFNVGDVRFHSVLLFNEAAVRACGPICQDLYGTYPNTTPANYPAAAKAIAGWVLRQLAERGNGVYQEFNNGEINNLGLGALDYSSMVSPNVMKSLVVQSLSAVPAAGGRLVDTDGDGLPDTLDNAFTFKTNNFVIDSDKDGFDDKFESSRIDRGFRANEKDGRGCDCANPANWACCRDTDGDGLPLATEEFLKTSTGVVDSDGDGVPDGLEARYGLDPLTQMAPGLDTDGDGIPDDKEFKADSDPTVRDREFYEEFGYQYETTAEKMPNGSTCYDFSVSNLSLVTPPTQAGKPQGFNLYKLWFGEAPESGVATDYGVWRTACSWAQYAPPTIRAPVGAELELQNTNFMNPSQMIGDPATFKTRCVGAYP